MKLLTVAAMALAAFALPLQAQALSISIVWSPEKHSGVRWSEHVQTGLMLSLSGQEGIEINDAVSYSSPENFAEVIAGIEADVIITDFAEAGSLSEASPAPALFMNLGRDLPATCGTNTLHLAGDVALGRLAALYMNGLNAQRTFAFVKENDEGKQHLSDFRRSFTGGLGGAAFAEPGQTSFDNEIAILRVTKADGAYFDLEGDALYRYLDAFTSFDVPEALSTVTTSEIDYDRLGDETRKALSSLTLVSAWNADTVDARPFKTAFRDRVGEDPSFAGLMGFEAGDLLMKAAATENTDLPLFDSVVGMSWQSPRGPVSFDPQGYAIVPVGAYRFTETALSLKGRISVSADHACKTG